MVEWQNYPFSGLVPFSSSPSCICFLLS
uniref:Uncharacterized protein n=1 Tax=Arundo donax TaxID=35708 RepID=A0A0A9BJZ7_ARUDO